jgi:DNA-binding transcriptional LysR family regulator
MPRLSVPLANLEVFAEAGRLSSFKLAADNLALTTSAVSQSIRKLEDRLDCQLFLRSNNRLALTPAGRLLLRHIEDGFDHIRHGLTAITPDSGRPLSFSSPPGIAAQLLGPALVDLMSEQATDIRITADETPDFQSYRGFDVAIVYGAGARAIPDIEPLGPDTFVPVCATHLAEHIRTIADLKSHLLLANETNAVTWKHWFDFNGFDDASIRRLSYNRISYIVPTLIKGGGVGLEALRLLSPQIARGELAICAPPGTQPVVQDLTFLHVTDNATRRPRALNVAKLIRDRCRTGDDGLVQNATF